MDDSDRPLGEICGSISLIRILARTVRSWEEGETPLSMKFTEFGSNADEWAFVAAGMRYRYRAGGIGILWLTG